MLRSVVILIVAACLVTPSTTQAKKRKAAGKDTHAVFRLAGGLVLPYPLDNLFRGFAECKRGRWRHRALDIGGVGPDWGVGTPIRSIARSRITRIGTPEKNPEKYGQRDLGEGEVKRGRKMLPRSAEVPGYGVVHFFTKDYGRSRTGVIVTARVLEGRLKGYTLRYMHLAAPHPELKPGRVVEAGQEIGLMGGTAVQQDPPHLHLSVANRRGTQIDIGPLFGIGSTVPRCRNAKSAWKVRKRYTARARKLMLKLRRQVRAERKRTKLVASASGCGTFTHQGTIGSKRQHAIRFATAGTKGRWKAQLETVGKRWKPRMKLLNAWGTELDRARTAGRGKLSLKLGKKLPAELVLQIQGRGKRAPKGAGYKLTVERPCRK